MKKISIIIISLISTLLMAFSVSAKASPVTMSKITTKDTSITLNFPSKAKWKVKVYAKKSGKKKKYKNIATFTTKKVVSCSVDIKKQKKSTSIKVVANKKGKKTKYTVKTTVVKYSKPKTSPKQGINDAQPTPNEGSRNKLNVTADTYWWDYYLTDPDKKQVNSYLMVDTAHDDGSGENISYAFICGSTIHSVRWYDKDTYNALMKEIKSIIASLHITDSMTEQEKAFRVARYLAENISVPSSGSPSLDVCILEKKSMCMGLAEAFSVLCKYINIDCDCIYDDGHEWNIVKIGKLWYEVDVYGLRQLRNQAKKGYNVDFLGGMFGASCQWKYSNACFKTKEYLQSHPSSELSFYMVSKRDGTEYMLPEELVTLPY